MIRTSILDRLRLRYRVLTTRVERVDDLVRELDTVARHLDDVRDDRDRLAVQLDRIAAELRAAGHPVSIDLPNDVGLALAVERGRTRLVEALALDTGSLPTSVIESIALCGADLDGTPCCLRAGHRTPCDPSTPPTGYRRELDTGTAARLAAEYDQRVATDRGVVR